MVDVNEVKNRIVNILKAKGPSLPVQISRELRMETIFISAFLGELLNEKRIKTSNLRVGGTPLYLLEGQEIQLENFQKYLHPKEQEAFLLLKNSRILKDSSQEPAIRVAIRAIKDFAISFKNNEEIYWRYLTVTEDEVKNILEPKLEIKEEIPEVINEKKPEVKIEIKEEGKKTEIKEEIPEEKEKKIEIKIPKVRKPREKSEQKIQETRELTEFTNPLANKIEIKPEKVKPKSEFVLKVIHSLEKNNFKILEEKEYNKKEFNCIAQINTELGPIAFLTQGKDKKTISDQDLDKLLRQAQSLPLPALMLIPGTLSRKALEYQQKYYSILKVKKI